MININVDLMGFDKARRMLAVAPRRMRGAITNWMMAEKRRYIGTKKKPMGVFGRKLSRLRLGAGAPGPFRRGGKWDEKLAASFSGYFKTAREAGPGGEMMTKWGPGLKKKTGFLQGLNRLDASTSGKTVETSEGMAIPFYQNLTRKNIPVRMQNGKNTALTHMFENMKWAAIRRGDDTFYVDTTDRYRTGPNKGQLRKSAYLFLRKKEISLTPKFDFEGGFKGQESASIKRGENNIKRTIRALELGYLSFK